jgi:metal-dependent amidase/aminoacylase/carboxypeptidase family protein
MDVVDLEFRGVASHAASAPEQGRNALDGVLLTFSAVNALRQQIRSDARIHGIVTNGGAAVNIIPETAAARFGVRASDRAYERDLLKRVIACAEAAARASDTDLISTMIERWAYADLLTSTPIAQRWGEHLGSLGMELAPTPYPGFGSTDMGNVSHVVPSIHPYLAVAPRGTPVHSAVFRDAAATDDAHIAALVGARALARTVIDLLRENDLLDAATRELRARRGPG